MGRDSGKGKALPAIMRAATSLPHALGKHFRRWGLTKCLFHIETEGWGLAAKGQRAEKDEA